MMSHPTIPFSGDEITPEPNRKGPAFMIVPLDILHNDSLTPNAKLLYCRLLLFAGKDGRCNPSQETLMREMRVGNSQIRTLLNELRKYSLVQWKRTQTSCSYAINPPECFVDPDCQNTGSPIVDKPTSGVSVNQQQKEVLEGLKDVLKRDLDCPVTIPKKRGSQPGVRDLPLPKPRPYPEVREAIARAMAENPKKPQPEDYPSDELVVKVVDASQGETSTAVVDAINYFRFERKLAPGKRGSPQYFSWWITAVDDYFRQQRAREDASSPIGYHEWEERNETKMMNMAAAFEPVDTAVA